MSSTQSLIEVFAKYLETCPVLLVREVMISVVPHELSTTGYYLANAKKEPNSKAYIDGTRLKQTEYSFCCVTPRMQSDHSYHYMFDKFQKWVEDQNSIGEYSAFAADGIHVESIEILYPFSFAEQDTQNIRYECKLRLSYTREEQL